MQKGAISLHFGVIYLDEVHGRDEEFYRFGMWFRMILAMRHGASGRGGGGGGFDYGGLWLMDGVFGVIIETPKPIWLNGAAKKRLLGRRMTEGSSLPRFIRVLQACFASSEAGLPDCLF